jgi:alpha-1,4-digalacturonate transport system permease protein
MVRESLSFRISFPIILQEFSQENSMESQATLTIPYHAKRKRPPVLRILLIVMLMLGTVVTVAPFYWTLISSFKTPSEYYVYPPTWWPNPFTLNNWIGLNNLEVGSFGDFFLNSLIVCVTGTIIALLTSSMAGYIFAKYKFRGRDIIFLGILSLMMIPFNVTMIPIYKLMVMLKLNNTLVPLILTFGFYPFGIFLMRQFIHSIPSELIDAARIDGANEFDIFFRIILPLSTAALSALGIFVFITLWDDFLWPFIIIDKPDLYTLPLGLSQFRGKLGMNVGGLAAGTMLAVLPVIVFYLIAQRRFIEGITMTGMKS